MPITGADRARASTCEWVDPEDPRYFDTRFFARPAPGQSWVDARFQQVEAIKTRAAKHRSSQMRQWPYQISHARGGLRESFSELVPKWPYCVDHLKEGEGLRKRPKAVALTKRHLQFNPQSSITWMIHDYDRADSARAHQTAGLPEPNVLIVNPENQHSHAAYLLAAPVARHSASRVEPLRYYAAVERGIARRLGADRQYTGLIAKNPLHPGWIAEWRRDEPYSLGDLAAGLSKDEMRADFAPKSQSGAGRNVTAFDGLRGFAYREVLQFKSEGQSLDSFCARLEQVALEINRQFPQALPMGEIRATAKSVAKWTWRHFSEHGFTARQRSRGKRGAAKRWADHVSASATKPWEAEGISRAQWYRRQAAAKAASDMS